MSQDFVNYTKTTHHDTYPFIDPTKAPNSHKGLSVLVTGASKGIGRATALALAASGAYRIAIAARSSLDSLVPEIEKAATSAGHPAPLVVLPLSMDISSESSVDAAISRLSAAFSGKLDLLLNNAGYLEPFTPLASSSPTEWWTRSYSINIFGTYLVTRACMPLLLAASPSTRSRTIINFSSVGAHRIRPGASAYQSAKFALLRITEFINAEYGDGGGDGEQGGGILAYSIHPGGIPTELALGMPEAVHGILVDSLELASHSILWMTRERREWLRGRYVSCNWDLEELEARKEDIVARDALKVRLAL